MPIPLSDQPPDQPSDQTSDRPATEAKDPFSRGIDEFNNQSFYACHDTLEAIWMEEETAEKPFYQGILQIAVAFYHLGNLNWRGGAILLGEGINRLRRFEPTHQGVAVEALVDEAVEWLELVQTAGIDGLAELMAAPPRELPRIGMWKGGEIENGG